MLKKKKLTVKEKLFNDIDSVISIKLSLTGLKEFENYFRTELFTAGPDQWNELEIAICDYNMRIQTELETEIKKLLIK